MARTAASQLLPPHRRRHGVRFGVVDESFLHRRSSRHGRAARARTGRRRPLRRLAGIDKLRYPLPGEGSIGLITTAVRHVPGVRLIGLDLVNRSVVVTGHELDGAAVRAAIIGVADDFPPLSAGVELLLVLGLEVLRPPPAPESR